MRLHLIEASNCAGVVEHAVWRRRRRRRWRAAAQAEDARAVLPRARRKAVRRRPARRLAVVAAHVALGAVDAIVAAEVGARVGRAAARLGVAGGVAAGGEGRASPRARHVVARLKLDAEGEVLVVRVRARVPVGPGLRVEVAQELHRAALVRHTQRLVVASVGAHVAAGDRHAASHAVDCTEVGDIARDSPVARPTRRRGRSILRKSAISAASLRRWRCQIAATDLFAHTLL